MPNEEFWAVYVTDEYSPNGRSVRCLIEAGSPEEVAEQLGGEYQAEHGSIYFPSSLFKQKENYWEYQKGNFEIRIRNPSNGAVAIAKLLTLFRE